MTIKFFFLPQIRIFLIGTYSIPPIKLLLVKMEWPVEFVRDVIYWFRIHL